MTVLRLRPEGIHWVESDGEIVALDERSSAYFSTGRTGRVLWAQLVGGATRDALVESLTEAFAVEPERAAADVDRFLAQLDDAGLLEPA